MSRYFDGWALYSVEGVLIVERTLGKLLQVKRQWDSAGVDETCQVRCRFAVDMKGRARTVQLFCDPEPEPSVRNYGLTPCRCVGSLSCECCRGTHRDGIGWMRVQDRSPRKAKVGFVRRQKRLPSVAADKLKGATTND